MGSYDYTSLGFDLTTNPSAPLSLDLRADVGGFYNGTRRGGSVTLAARHASSLTTSLRVEYNDVRLDQGNFVRSLIATRVAYFFTPRVLLQTLVQYSNQARVWTANARFGWHCEIHAPVWTERLMNTIIRTAGTWPAPCIPRRSSLTA